MINLELLEGGDELFLDLLNDLPVSIDIQDMSPSMSLDLMISEPLSLDLVSGGIVGDPGLKGDKGDPGATGDKGDKGDPGIQGLKGDKGDKGDTGDTGIAGAVGAKGDQGIQGEIGLQGIQGVKGDKGDPGATGATGATGDKGDKGDKGDPGATGDIAYSATSSEAIGSGKNINEWVDSGVMKVRLADNSGLKPSHGFTKEAFASGVAITYYKAGVCPVVGASVGAVYLGTNGDFTSTAPIEGSGLILQPLGMAASPTTIYYSKETPVLLAGT